MRHARNAALLAVALAAASCSSSGAPVDTTGRTQSAIAYGTSDATHTAVVSILAGAGGGSFDECSGTIVQVKSGNAYVLTAAHCCNATTPTVVVVSSDYAAGESAVVSGGAPSPPAYAVVTGSVWFDAQYNGSDHDFCMLQFPAPAGAAVIPVAQPGADGLALGVQVEHVGFGQTDTNTGNTGRRHETSPVDLSLTSLIAQSSQGGASKVGGLCEGDSGGPGLLPAGAAQSAQMVVMTTSFGASTTCATNTSSTCSRVSSETGPGGFITNYLADAPSGTQAGSAAAMCDTCAQASQTGACQTQATACANDAACTTLSTCLGGCTTTACDTTCQNAASSTAQAELNAYDTCICNTACTSQCAAQCTGGSCGVMSSDATCNTCLDTSCCSQGSACASDGTCLSCLGASTPPASCSSNASYSALTTCIDTTCGAACGSSATDAGLGVDASGGHDAGKGGDAASKSDGASTVADSGGDDGGPTGNGDDGGDTTASSVSRSGGCSVGSHPREPSAPVLGAVTALALALARRRLTAGAGSRTRRTPR